MKRIVIGLVLAASSIFLVGCGSSDANSDYEAPEPVVERQSTSNTYVETQQAYGSVEKVTIDGVTCMVYDGSGSGGITCDWSHTNGTGEIR